MTTIKNAILWTATSQVNLKNISVQVCDSATDTDWRFVTEGTDINGQGFQAAYAIVDNLLNTFTATIVFGPQSYGVAPFTRRTFPLPNPTPMVEIQLTGGIVTLTLCQADMGIPDEQNQLASAASSGGMAEYNPYFNRNGPLTVASEVLFVHYFEEPVQYQNNFNGSEGGVARVGGVNPAADYVVSVYRGATLVGSVTFHPTGLASFATVGGTSGNFAAGDCLTCQGQITPDTALQNFSATFAMAAI